MESFSDINQGLITIFRQVQNWLSNLGGNNSPSICSMLVPVCKKHSVLSVEACFPQKIKNNVL